MGGSDQRLRRDTRGVVLVEYLVALLPVLTCALGMLQWVDLYAARLSLARAAAITARSAAVVLPDDPRRYAGAPVNEFTGRRRVDVELSAALSLVDSRRFESVPKVQLSAARAHQALTALVSAEYRCVFLPLMCGGSSLELSAEAHSNYHGAMFTY
jgi:Flp pilus assembly protein TadG